MEGICELEEIDGEEWVVFDDDFNQELTSQIIEFLSNYERVEFGDFFNQQFDISDEDSPTGKSSILPNSLTHLKFGKFFNQPVDKLPNSLINLEFGFEFNQSVDNLPNTLTYLKFGQYFNQPVTYQTEISQNGKSPTLLPNSLTHLVFGSRVGDFPFWEISV